MGAGGFGDQFALDGERPAVAREAACAALAARGELAFVFLRVIALRAVVEAEAAPLLAARLVGLRALPARRAVARAERGNLVEARRAITAGSAPTAAALALGDLDVLRRQLVEEARGNGGGPGAVNAAVGGEVEFGAAARARQPDMGEAALFFQPGAALVVQRALARKQSFLPAGQEHVVELQTLCRMQRHQRHRVVERAVLAVHDQGNVLEKTLQVLELLHRANELLQVVEAALRVGRAVLLPHLGVAALVEDDLGKLGVRNVRRLRAPALEILDHCAQARARLRLQLVGADHGRRRIIDRNALLARMVVQQLQRRVAKTTFGHVDDAVEGEVVGGRVDHAQIRQRVADLRGLVKARAADHPIGQAEGDEAILELAHLERGADENGDLVQLLALALDLLDLLADRARLFLRIPGAGDGHLLAIFVLGAQRLAEPALVVRDQVGRGGEDVAGGAVVALQANDLGAGKVVVEAQDVVHLGAAPAIDRLIVVADAADVLGVRWCGRRGLALRDAWASPKLLRVRVGGRVGRVSGMDIDRNIFVAFLILRSRALRGVSKEARSADIRRT